MASHIVGGSNVKTNKPAHDDRRVSYGHRSLFIFLPDPYQIVCPGAPLGELPILFACWRAHSSYHIVCYFPNGNIQKQRAIRPLLLDVQAFADNPRCSDWRFPRLGLTIPNAGISDSQCLDWPSSMLGFSTSKGLSLQHLIVSIILLSNFQRWQFNNRVDSKVL